MDAWRHIDPRPGGSDEFCEVDEIVPFLKEQLLACDTLTPTDAIERIRHLVEALTTTVDEPIGGEFVSATVAGAMLEGLYLDGPHTERWVAMGLVGGQRRPIQLEEPWRVLPEPRLPAVEGSHDARVVTTRAHGIAQELVEEILTRRFDELSAQSGGNWSVIGIDSGENAADMTTFDDIDDFNGWSEAMGWPYAGFTRTVSIIYVDDSDLEVASTRDKNYKRVNVQVSNNAVNYSTMTTVSTPTSNPFS